MKWVSLGSLAPVKGEEEFGSSHCSSSENIEIFLAFCLACLLGHTFSVGLQSMPIEFLVTENACRT